MSSKTKSTKERGGKITSAAHARVQQSTTKLYRGGKYNIVRHRGKQKKCCIVQHLFGETFDRDQTSYNRIQHDKTRYNKVAKRVQHFIKHQSCMMLCEMLYSFGRGLNGNQSALVFTCLSFYQEILQKILGKLCTKFARNLLWRSGLNLNVYGRLLKNSGNLDIQCFYFFSKNQLNEL